MTLGKKIKHYRNALNITQEQLASITKIHKVTLKKYETDVLVPLPKQLSRIADALNVSVEELLYSGNSEIKLTTLGDMYGFVITLIKNGILIAISPQDSCLEDLKLILNPYFKNFFDVRFSEYKDDTSGLFIYINNKEFLTNIFKWNKMNTELEARHIENYDLLKKKGNCLTIEERKIVFDIEKLELNIEKFEMELKSLKKPLVRNPQK